MKNWMLGALALAVIIGVVALLWNLQSEGKTPPGEPQGKATAGQTAPGKSAARSMTGSARAQPDSLRSGDPDDPEPLRMEERTMEMEHLLAGDLPGRIREATAHCYDGSGFSYKQLENDETSLDFDYTAYLKDGVFTLRDIKVTKKFGTSTDDCVVKELSRLTWKDPVNPDFTMAMSDSIKLLELKKWGEPMPHELEEVPEDPEDGDFSP